MKKQILTITAMLLSFPALHSQTFFKIAGGNVKVKGNPHMVLKDASWVNNGTFSGDSATVHFTGTQEDSIDGSSTTTFWNLDVNKTSGGSVKMKNDIGVDSAIMMNGGLVNLNGNDMTLGTDNGVIVNESNANRIVGPNGGEIIKVMDLNTPSSANPGNMGLEISSASNLGSTTIKRGHIPQNIPGGMSINRYFDVTPTNNTGANATVRMSYFDGELNSLVESTLEAWNDEGTNWINVYPDATDDVANYVETSMDTLGRTTLGSGALKFAGKIFLQSAYSGGLMNDDLRSKSLLPTTEPYSGMGFTQVGGGGETVSANVFDVTGNDAIVDWIYLQLRNKNDSSVIVVTKSVLLQRDGDIVDLDGVSPVTFAGIAEDDYYIMILHRNHLGIRTPGPNTLARIETGHDFTTSQSQAWDNPSVFNDQMVDVSGTGTVFGLYMGNVTSDRFVNATDFQATSNFISPNQNNVYHIGDLNLDGFLNSTDFQTSNNAVSPNKVGHTHD